MQDSGHFNRSKLEKSLDMLNSSIAINKSSLQPLNLLQLTDDDRLKMERAGIEPAPIAQIDSDTVLEGPDAPALLAAAFADPAVAGASGNITARNTGDSLWTALQGLEYLASITVGRSFLECDVKVHATTLIADPIPDLQYRLKTAVWLALHGFMFLSMASISSNTLCI